MALFLSILCLILNIYYYKKESIKYFYFTPIFCISIPYSIIMLFVSIYDLIDYQKAYKMSYLVPLVSILCFTIFKLIGVFFNYLDYRNTKPFILYQNITNEPEISNYPKFTNPFKKTNKKYINKFTGIKYDLDGIKLLNILLLLCFIAIIIIYCIKYGFKIIPSAEFKNFFSSGIQGHLVNLITGILLLIFSFKKFYKTKIISILWVIFLALGNAKYLMLMYAVTLLIIFATSNYKSINLKKIFLFLIVIASLFLLTYFMRFLIAGETITSIDYKFIFNHFIYYLVGSFYAFSKVLTNTFTPTDNVGVGIVIAPIINVLKLLTGNRDYVTSISRFIPVEINSNYSETNVYTLFGAIYFETSMGFMILFIIILSLFSYFLYYKFLKNKKQSTLLIYSFFISSLFYSFFNCFYGASNLIEILIIIIALTFICMRYKNVKR